MIEKRDHLVSTFSIIGYDDEKQEWGIAVQSKFLAVGAVVPWAKACVGAIATQSYANPAYGPEGLAMLEQGYSAEEVLKYLVEKDPERNLRQVGIVDREGRSAAFTGSECYSWAGHITGKHYTAQGNILVREETVQAMAKAFETSEGDLADRLLAALAAGGQAGGDSRGEQSACLLVVKEKGGYGGFNDRYIDLRVDDHKTPIQELIRIHRMFRLYFYETKPENILPIDDILRENISRHLMRTGYLSYAYNGNKDQFYRGLEAFHRTENFEMRMQERGFIDQEVLEYLRSMSDKIKK